MPIIMNCTQLEQTKLPIQCKTCQKRRSMAAFTTTDADTNNCNDINDKTGGTIWQHFAVELSMYEF